MSSLDTSPLPVVVCDMGTDTTRLGYAGNSAPTWTLPTLCAWTEPLAYDSFRLGHAADTCSTTAQKRSLLDHGSVVDWDLYEAAWRHVFHHTLCIESSDVGVVLADAARTPPEQRETIAEVLFESFGVAKLCVGSQALFALGSLCEGCDTGLVVMGGAGMTQVVPVVDGYAVSEAAQHFPVAGRDVTQYILDSLRTREKSVEAAHAWAVAERVKTQHGYVAADITQELSRFDADLAAHVVRHGEQHSRTGRPYELEVGRERFLGPEAYFQPALFGAGSTTPTASLAAAMDAAVRSCPIDCRRRLYANVVVCGGGLRFPNFTARLEQELRALLAAGAASFGLARPTSYEVTVRDCTADLACVWRGGGALGGSARFGEEATTRAAYMERGRLCAATV